MGTINKFHSLWTSYNKCLCTCFPVFYVILLRKILNYWYAGTLKGVWGIVGTKGNLNNNTESRPHWKTIKHEVDILLQFWASIFVFPTRTWPSLEVLLIRLAIELYMNISYYIESLKSSSRPYHCWCTMQKLSLIFWPNLLVISFYLLDQL